jgi:hypothetical protein
MNVGLGLFLSSASFGIAIAIAYWFSAHDDTGTWLLGMMGIALGFAAGYMIVAEREARLAGDQPNGSNEESAGERVGTYTLRSPWPFCAAIAAAFVLIGAVYNLPVAVAAFVSLLVTLTMLIRESR